MKSTCRGDIIIFQGYVLFPFYSVSSNYDHLMPQFLRAVRMLCALYPLYTEALQEKKIVTTYSGSGSPPEYLDPFHIHSSRRSESFGSLLEGSLLAAASPNVAGQHHPPRRSGHRRTHSQPGNGSEDSNTTDWGFVFRRSTASKAPLQQPTQCDNPFKKLEMVWDSLRSWFSLIRVEVEKVIGDSGDTIGDTGVVSLATRGEKKEEEEKEEEKEEEEGEVKEEEEEEEVEVVEVGATAATPQLELIPAEMVAAPSDLQEGGGEGGEGGGERGRGRGLRSFPPIDPHPMERRNEDCSPSNQMAAAIVLSAPLRRREVYLR